MMGPDINALRALDDDTLAARHAEAAAEFEALVARDLSIDMARGKPGPEQLAESGRLLELPGADDYLAADGTDCRTYGGDVRGLPEARALLAPLVGAAPEQVMAAGNSSIALMHDALVYALLNGLPDSPRPWSAEPRLRILCPVPGYDFHFNLLAGFGIEMVPVPLTGQGPDMAVVESRVAEDPSIKGLIGVPRYSNPTGETYSDDSVARLAGMPTAAPDFRLFWDNAYAVHHLDDEPPALANILEACAAAGHPDRALVFGSTSKITLPGAGVAAFAASPANLAWFAAHAGRRSIGPDKINQLRHVRFFAGGWPDIERLMARHAAHLAPKFDAVDTVFTNQLGDSGLAAWQRPQGGYFISLYTPPGCAAAVVARAAQAGVTLTPAGSAFPHGQDPRDHHLRIAPTSLAPLHAAEAAEVVAQSLRLVAHEAACAERDSRCAAGRSC